MNRTLGLAALSVVWVAAVSLAQPAAQAPAEQAPDKVPAQKAPAQKAQPEKAPAKAPPREFFPRLAAPHELPGTVMLAGGNWNETIARDFVERAGGDKARIVVIPTASQTADDADAVAKHVDVWKPFGPAQVTLLHTRDRATANEADFVAPLADCTAVWLGEGDQSRLTAAYLGTRVERELAAVLARGGLVGGSSAGAACLGRVMITGGARQAETAPGFNLLAAIVETHLLQRSRLDRLHDAVAKHPGLPGLGVDEDTVLIIERRDIRFLGKSYAAGVWGPSPSRAARCDVWKAGDQADYVAAVRAALARTQPEFPPPTPTTPDSGAGTLVIVGGGGMTPEILERFLQAAGGPEAPILIVPSAIDDRVPLTIGEQRMLERAGAKNLHIFHPRKRADLSDEAFLAPLRKARGVWFSGGRQWRFVDVFGGTPVEGLFRDVLRRGGVIGGSSAGASIQADFMPRGNPLGNFEMMAEGYERGFGFLPGTAIDQHFTQRGRFRDMTSLVNTHPQLLGLGIDESTAAIVQGHVLEVVGKNHLAIYDRQAYPPPADYPRDARGPPSPPDFLDLKPGEKYDLQARKKLAAE